LDPHKRRTWDTHYQFSIKTLLSKGKRQKEIQRMIERMIGRMRGSEREEERLGGRP